MNWEIIGLGALNLGVVVWLAKRVVQAVDEHKQVLPGLVATVSKIGENQSELFNKLHGLEGDFREHRGRVEAHLGSGK